MIIALTCENNQIFQHYGRTPAFAIYEVADGKVKSSKVVPTGETGHGALAGFLRQHGVDLLICGGIGGGARQALFDEGITLVGGASGNVDGVLKAYLDGTLKLDAGFECNHHHEHGEEHACGGHGGSCGGNCANH